MNSFCRFLTVAACVAAFSGCSRANADASSSRPSSRDPRTSLTSTDRAAVAKIEQLGGTVTILPPAEVPAHISMIACSDPRESPAYFLATKESGPKIIVRVPRDADLTGILGQLAKVVAAKKLDLANRPASDSDVRTISRVPGLEQLTIDAQQVSDAGLAPLTKMGGLRRLDIENGQCGGIQRQLARFPSSILVIQQAAESAAGVPFARP